MSADPTAARRPERLVGGLVLLVLLGALAIRLPEVFQGAYGNRDELNYVPKAVRYGGGDPNPRYFHNPPLASYLMFLGIGVRYAVGRAAGTIASALDFKAQFLLDGAGAFEAARLVSLVLGLATVAHAAVLAGRLAGDSVPASRRRWAAAVAALALAVAPLHVERSAMATNEALVTLVHTLAVHAALVLVRTGTWRAAVVAGVAAGLAGASKYTGAMACAPVAVAALAAAGRPWPARVRLLATAGAAAVGAFLIACPWAVLDAGTFRAHVAEQAGMADRFEDGQGWRRYLVGAWTDGLGPAGSVVALAGLAGWGRTAMRGGADDRRTAWVALTGALALALFLFLQTRLAYSRYLLPAYPAFVALGASALARLETPPWRWARPAAVAGLLVWAAFPASAAVRAAREASSEDTRVRTWEWMRAHVPDGARVLTDWWAPRLPRHEDRAEFEGRVPDSTLARFTPAFRSAQAFDYFARPLGGAPGSDVAADDFDGLRALGGVWFVVSPTGPAIYTRLPPAEYPGARWYEGVARETRVVHVESPGPGVRGPTVEVRVLR